MQRIKWHQQGRDGGLARQKLLRSREIRFVSIIRDKQRKNLGSRTRSLRLGWFYHSNIDQLV